MVGFIPFHSQAIKSGLVPLQKPVVCFQRHEWTVAVVATARTFLTVLWEATFLVAANVYAW